MFGLAAFSQTTFSNLPPSSPICSISGVVGTGQTGTIIGQQIQIVAISGVQGLVILNSGTGGVTTPQVWTLLDTSQN